MGGKEKVAVETMVCEQKTPSPGLTAVSFIWAYDARFKKSGEQMNLSRGDPCAAVEPETVLVGTNVSRFSKSGDFRSSKKCA